MGWDYISELWHLTGLLFISQAIYKKWSYGGTILTGEKPNNSEKNLSAGTFSTTNPRWTDTGVIKGHRRQSVNTVKKHSHSVYAGWHRSSMKITAFCVTALCNLVELHRRFRCVYCLHHLSPWWWRQYAPVKRESISTKLHGAMSQNYVLNKLYYLLVIINYFKSSSWGTKRYTSQ
jgi:hypothetical protein